MKLILTIVLFLAGVALCCFGIYEIYWPAACIVGGVAISAVAAVVIDAKPDPPKYDDPL
jgi:hypothetical protein